MSNNPVNYHVVKLYFPSKDKYNHPIDQSISNPIYKDTIKQIISLSGGLTVYPTTGFYQNSAGLLIDEDISVIQVYTDNLARMSELMHSTANIILDKLEQESVLVECDNIPEFIIKGE